MGKMNRGGVEAVVMNYYRAMDKNKVQFDFFVDEDSEFPQREELEKAGAGIYMLPPYSRMWAWRKKLKEILRENHYTIVHAHINTMNVFPLFEAWAAGVPVRVCHNHSTAHTGEGKKTILKYLLRPFAKCFATDWFACGEKAGEWMYGKKAVASGRVNVLRNAVDTRHFAFDGKVRAKMRTQLGLKEGQLTIGHIGRYTYAKNHAFLLETFAALLKKEPNAMLLLVGEGERAEQVQDIIQALELGDHVLQLGAQADTAPIYSAMDVFCLPSFYEGVPVVALEAQAADLPCVFSKAVPQEACVKNKVCFLSLEAPQEQWVDALLKCKGVRQKSAADAVEKAGFDIWQQAKRLEEFYLEKINC